MGNKTHPVGFRLGVIKDWQTRWFAAKQKDYRSLVKEDLAIRRIVLDGNQDAGISRVEIERGTNELVVTAHTARPGIVIGRGGAKVDGMRKKLEQLTSSRVRLNVQEIRQPDLDAFLVARNIADQLERRIAFRRAIRQTMTRTMQAGAEGIKIIAGGRLGGAEIARVEKAMEGRVPLHTLRADIDFDIAEAATDFGRIGVKVWIFKGEILPEPKQQQIEFEQMSPIQVTVRADQDTRLVPEAPASGVSPTQPTQDVRPASVGQPAGEGTGTIEEPSNAPTQES